MRRRPSTPKELIAAGIIFGIGEFPAIFLTASRKQDHWVRVIVMLALFELVAVGMVYTGIKRLKKEKARKAADEAAKEKIPILNKRTMIDQVRKVLNIFRQKEEVRNIGVYKDYIYRYEQQLLALEQDLNQNCISGACHIYAENDAYAPEDPFIDEIGKAERMLHDYLLKEASKLKQPVKQEAYLPATAQMEVTIDGSKISSYQDFIDIVQKELQFPEHCGGRVDRFLEQIRDLSWLPYKIYVFTIYNTADLERRNNALLKQIVGDFDRNIIPFWRHQVVYAVVDGEPKNVHLNLIEGEDCQTLTPLECYIIDALASELEKEQNPHSDLLRKENIVSKESTPYYSFLFLPRTIEYSVAKPGRSYLELEVSLDHGYPVEVLLHEMSRTFSMIEIYMADSSAIPKNPVITGHKKHFTKA